MDNQHFTGYCQRVLRVVMKHIGSLLSNDVLASFGSCLTSANDAKNHIVAIVQLVQAWNIDSYRRQFPEDFYRGISSSLQRYSRDALVVRSMLDILKPLEDKLDWELFAECGLSIGLTDVINHCSLEPTCKSICRGLLNRLPRDEEMEQLERWCCDAGRARAVVAYIKSWKRPSVCKKLLTHLQQFLTERSKHDAIQTLEAIAKPLTVVIIQAFVTAITSEDMNAMVSCIDLVLKLFQVCDSPWIVDELVIHGLNKQLVAIMSFTTVQRNSMVMTKLAEIVCFSSSSGEVDCGLNAVDMVHLGLQGACEYICNAMKTSDENPDVFYPACKIALRLCELSIENTIRFMTLDCNAILLTSQEYDLPASTKGIVEKLHRKLSATGSRRTSSTSAPLTTASSKSVESIYVKVEKKIMM